MKTPFLTNLMGLLGFQAAPITEVNVGETPSVAIDAHEIEDLFEHIFAQIEIGDRAASQYAWKKHVFSEIADLCATLLSDYPATRMVGIGNSPSYIIHGIAQLAAQRQQELAAIHVPFSGSYLKLYSRNKPCQGTFKLNKKSLYYKATMKYQGAYRKFLAARGIHPKQIYKDFSEQGLITGFIDNVQDGTSFASFLHFVFNWAKECGLPLRQFTNAVRCIALSTNPFPSQISLPNEKLTFVVDVIIISEPLRLAINSNLSAESDRFVPHYPPLLWNKPPIDLASRNAPVIKTIQEAVAKAVRGVQVSGSDLALPAHPGNIYRDQYFNQIRAAFVSFGQPSGAGQADSQILRKPPRKLLATAKPQSAADNKILAVEDQAISLEHYSTVLSETAPSVVVDENELNVCIDRSWTFAEASDAAVKLLKAFATIENELSNRHLQLFKRAEGLGLNWRPVGLELTANQMHISSELAMFKILQVRNHLGDAVALENVMQPNSETLIEALRIYEKSPVMDKSITDAWLANEDDTVTAAEIRLSPLAIKAAHARVIGRVTQALLHDHPALTNI